MKLAIVCICLSDIKEPWFQALINLVSIFSASNMYFMTFPDNALSLSNMSCFGFQKIKTHLCKIASAMVGASFLVSGTVITHLVI